MQPEIFIPLIFFGFLASVILIPIMAKERGIILSEVKRDKSGVLSYTVAVRSLDGAGTQRRGVRLSPGVGIAAPQKGWARCTLPLTNTGTAGTAPYGDSDVYRLSATTSGVGACCCSSISFMR